MDGKKLDERKNRLFTAAHSKTSPLAHSSSLLHLRRALDVQDPAHGRPLLDGAGDEETGRAVDLVAHGHLGPPAKDAADAADLAQGDGVGALDRAEQGFRRVRKLLRVCAGQEVEDGWRE